MDEIMGGQIQVWLNDEEQLKFFRLCDSKQCKPQDLVKQMINQMIAAGTPNLTGSSGPNGTNDALTTSGNRSSGVDTGADERKHSPSNGRQNMPWKSDRRFRLGELP